MDAPSFTSKHPGEKERLAQIVAALSRLEGWIPENPLDGVKRRLIEWQANLIECFMSEVIAAGRKSRGPARELRDLERLARKAAAGRISPADWKNAWRATPSQTRLMLRQSLERGAPPPKKILRRIMAEVEWLKAQPAAERRRRRRDGAENDAITRIRFAFSEVTHRRGGRAFNDEGKLDSPLVRFGREIDEIFGTRLFAVKDSRRLRGY
jgi:hypothetical protein